MKIETTDYVYSLLYNGGFGKYVEEEKRVLTEDEYKRINKALIDEMDAEKE